ncbi:hypothetical protein VSR01_03960 [Actinacidiphila sp. DG2A-62]|uniref:hypothetical protein n=1 Tax=Actinacidiphila sp. DG2A-62 TaxID=3108821 RepID=UPI002DBBE5C6|nr:hypothetical protein [Actinacidiphila sp. DG2A-62]MEC3992749.1 hypothetical protein [Actinacidiphila sp. DG2A-62]
MRDQDIPRAGSDIAAEINRIEVYLLTERERSLAREEAEAFAELMPWLLVAQREQVVHHYTRARLEISRHQLRAAAVRAGELRQEYEQRYHILRTRLLRRCTATVLAAFALTAALTATLVLTTCAHGG